MNQPTIYVASAGTGKTTALMEELEKALRNTPPEKIMFTTFTNAGAQEIAHRAAKRFPQYKEHQFRYFRTLHSIAYRSIAHCKMMAFGDYIEMGKELGVHINAKRAFNSLDGTVTNDYSLGDKLLHLDALNRNRRETFEQTAATQEQSSFSPKEIKDFSDLYRRFRRAHYKYDFTDQLELFLEALEQNDALAGIHHLFVDEAQDLSHLQWEIVRKISCSGHGEIRTILAGDDKQAIYGFNGGDPKTLIHMEGVRQVLDTTYRLPKEILDYSETIASRIQDTQEYTCKSTHKGGAVKNITHLGDLSEELKKGEWFVLVRNRKFLAEMEQGLDRMGLLYQSDLGNGIDPKLMEAITEWKQLLLGYGIPARVAKTIYSNYLRGADTVARGFKKTIQYLEDDESVDMTQLEGEFGLQTKLPWHQAFTIPEFMKDILKTLEETGELGKPPRIRVTTIHAVKGQEADNVVLLPDLSHLTRIGFNKEPDNEHRVFYVGATRAKSNLYIHQPITDYAYPL